MNWIDTIVMPLIVNIVAPVLLFLIASLVMKNNAVASFISKVYLFVKNRLAMEEQYFVNSNDIDKDAEKIKVSKKSDSIEESDVLRKTSKNYGVDVENGWDVRTFYIMTKQQVLNKKMINFKVKGNEFDIYVPTDTLTKRFSLDTEDERISDGEDRIRVYIYKKAGVDEYYLMRFGKRLTEPIRLEVLENNA